MNIIRKISVGSNYPDNVLHYQVGKPVRMGAEEKSISRIECTASSPTNGTFRTKETYKIYIEAEKGSSVLWKEIVDVPVVVEFLISFD